MSSLYTARVLEQNCLQHQCTAQKCSWKSQYVASLIYFNPANVSFSILLKPPQPQTMKHCSLAQLASKLTSASKQHQLTLRTAEPRRIKASHNELKILTSITNLRYFSTSADAVFHSAR